MFMLGPRRTLDAEQRVRTMLRELDRDGETINFAAVAQRAREIDRALTVLEEAGRLRRTTITDGRGRPAET